MKAVHARSELHIGQDLEVRIEKAVYRGLGLARHAGQVVFVRRALPGERLRVRVDEVSRGYVVASTRDRLETVPVRRASPCSHFALCGGCAYQEVAYPEQLHLKETILRECLARAGAPWEGEIEVASGPEESWRTRATFHVEAREGETRLGFHQEGTRRLVPIERCLQVSPAVMESALAVRRALQERRHLAARVREVTIVESPSGDERVVCLHGDLSPRESAALAPVADAATGLTGLGTAGPQGSFVLLRGSPYVHAEALGLRLRAHVVSFFQANRFLLETLLRSVCELTPTGGRVLDLFAGVGLFAMVLASRAEEVVAVEVNPMAARDAQANVAAAALTNVRVFRGDVGVALGRPRREATEHVVLDPPRTGAGPAVVDAIVRRRPASVIYVSCDPPTLGRDLARFAGHGYRVDSVRALDLFPDTFHLETVVGLRPA